MSTGTFFVGSLMGVGKVYLHAMVDTYGSYASGFLHVSKQPDAAVAALHNDVPPFHHRRKPVLKANSPTTAGSSAAPTAMPRM